MFLATLCWLFFTSELIGIVAICIEDKLKDLRKDSSVVQEDNHTVIEGVQLRRRIQPLNLEQS